MTKPFQGIVNIDIRDSQPDWEPYQQPQAPAGSPNVIYIVWDDVGFAAMEPFGGLIETPTMNRLAQGGAPLYQLAYHCTLLANSLMFAHRAQSHNERYGLYRRGDDRFSWLQRTYSLRVCHAC